jgi:hypothetical protein
VVAPWRIEFDEPGINMRRHSLCLWSCTYQFPWLIVSEMLLELRVWSGGTSLELNIEGSGEYKSSPLEPQAVSRDAKRDNIDQSFMTGAASWG